MPTPRFQPPPDWPEWLQKPIDILAGPFVPPISLSAIRSHVTNETSLEQLLRMRPSRFSNAEIAEICRLADDEHTRREQGVGDERILGLRGYSVACIGTPSMSLFFAPSTKAIASTMRTLMTVQTSFLRNPAYSFLNLGWASHQVGVVGTVVTKDAIVWGDLAHDDTAVAPSVTREPRPEDRTHHTSFHETISEIDALGELAVVRSALYRGIEEELGLNVPRPRDVGPHIVVTDDDVKVHALVYLKPEGIYAVMTTIDLRKSDVTSADVIASQLLARDREATMHTIPNTADAILNSGYTLKLRAFGGMGFMLTGQYLYGATRPEFSESIARFSMSRNVAGVQLD